METDRDFDILLMEIEEENIELVRKFYEDRMRARDKQETPQEEVA
jgi:hypothetical protein